MLLIVVEVAMLALSVLFLLSGASEKIQYRVANYAVGIVLLVLLIFTLYLWR